MKYGLIIDNGDKKVRICTDIAGMADQMGVSRGTIYNRIKDGNLVLTRDNIVYTIVLDAEIIKSKRKGLPFSDRNGGNPFIK